MAKVLKEFTDKIAGDWESQSYYEEAECAEWMATFWGPRSHFLPLFEQLSRGVVLELACGHGRHAARIADRVQRLILVDVNRGNIDFCRKRLSGRSNVEYLVNDGYTLREIESGSIDSIFCYDAMVHFEFDAVQSYLEESFRCLKPGGRALFHHSNYDLNPGGDYTQNPGWRNFMSVEAFRHLASRGGFRVLESRTLKWGNGSPKDSDAVTLLEKPQ